MLGADRAGMMRGALPVVRCPGCAGGCDGGALRHICVGDGDGRQVLSLLPAFLLRAKNQQGRVLGARGRFSRSGGAALSVPMAGGAFRFSC